MPHSSLSITVHLIKSDKHRIMVVKSVDNSNTNRLKIIG